MEMTTNLICITDILRLHLTAATYRHILSTGTCIKLIRFECRMETGAVLYPWE